MSAADVLIDQIFTIPVDMLSGFISTDLAWACVALIIILCIIFASLKICKFMNKVASGVVLNRSNKESNNTEFLNEYSEKENNV